MSHPPPLFLSAMRRMAPRADPLRPPLQEALRRTAPPKPLAKDRDFQGRFRDVHSRRCPTEGALSLGSGGRGRGTQGSGPISDEGSSIASDREASPGMSPLEAMARMTTMGACGATGPAMRAPEQCRRDRGLGADGDHTRTTRGGP
jgi:hypothetical protein